MRQRLANRRLLLLGAGFSLLPSSNACSNGGGPAPICNLPVEAVAPRLAAPLPGSSEVPTSTRTLIFTGDSLAIKLVSAAGSVATTPTSLPNPLPSPIATPQFAGASYYAISVPALTPATTYLTETTIAIYGCGTPTTYQTTNDGAFTTAAE